jgi:uncharacterized protein
MNDASAASAHGGTGRLLSLDILRGLALFGMLVVHFHAKSTEPGGIDDVIRTVVWRLVESKSHGTFALLFGAGFAVMLGRAEASGRPFVASYLRRLAVLAIVGFAAHALFGYNVLLGYALWGLALLVVRRWSTRGLILLALFAAVAPAIYQAMYGPLAVDATSVTDALHAAERQRDYGALVAARLAHMRWFHRQPFFLVPGPTLTLFVVGLLLVRHGVFAQPRAHGRVLAAMAVAGVVSWAVGNWLAPDLAVLLRDQWLTFTYVAAALAMLARWPALLTALRAVGNAGRMALTNYLLQIAGLDLLFSGYGIGLREIRPLWGVLAAAGCFAGMVACSSLWLARFRLGPAEWLWRSLTYGRVEPLRRPVAGVVLEA